MADIAFNWAEMESDLLNPKYSQKYLTADKVNFSEYKERSPDNIWIFRKEDHKYWILGRLSVDTDNTQRPKDATKTHWINYIPNKSEFFMPPIEVQSESIDSPSNLFKKMFRGNGQGSSAALLIEYVDLVNLKNLSRDYQNTINLSEFASKLSKGDITETPFRVAKVKSNTKQSTNKPSFPIQSNSNQIQNNDMGAGLEIKNNNHRMSMNESAIDSIGVELATPDEAILSDLNKTLENVQSEYSNISEENVAVFQNEVNDIENKQKILSEYLSPTEIDSWVKRRIGQGPFRTVLLKEFQNKCAISGLTDPSLLIASHIRPWSKCDEGQHRDPNNGLLLSVTWDALFDKFLISFEDDGAMITSELLDDSTLEKLGISEKPSLPNEYLTPKRCEFLKYHREHMFKKTCQS